MQNVVLLSEDVSAGADLSAGQQWQWLKMLYVHKFVHKFKTKYNYLYIKKTFAGLIR